MYYRTAAATTTIWRRQDGCPNADFPFCAITVSSTGTVEINGVVKIQKLDKLLRMTYDELEGLSISKYCIWGLSYSTIKHKKFQNFTIILEQIRIVLVLEILLGDAQKSG